MADSARSPEEALWRVLSSRLKARHFVLLSAINRHRVLRQVASELNLSQPAITKALQELEEIVGSPLFERTAHGLKPTPCAELLAPRGQAFLEDLRRLAGDLIAIQQGLHGTVRVGITPFISQNRLADAIDALRRENLSYRFVVRDDSTDVLVEALRKRELDCVIGRMIQASNEELRQEILYIQKPVVVAGIQHARPLSRRLTVADFARWDWILPPASTPMRRAFDEMLVRHKLMLPSPIMETISVPVIKGMLKRGGNNVCLLPDELAAEFEREGVAKVLPIKLDFPLPAVSFIARRESAGDKTLDNFERALRAANRRKRAGMDQVSG